MYGSIGKDMCLWIFQSGFYLLDVLAYTSEEICTVDALIFAGITFSGFLLDTF